ncbi:threonine/serine exporter family protein [Heliobacterium chlorum]|uniref:Threonine/serine exporter family protein n=1 Tax=Heliobacterium chlorum TaxID=2698 RepID=A0ABR7T2G9_HELCL|nr:threonine/serine exporter family protein [Heliobacterium chlorum]MBC9784846.1 threonine/serine exporter family protein [Heliobacterium chlorum]
MAITGDLIYSFIVTVAFGLLQQIPPKTLLSAGLIGVAGRAIFLICSYHGQAPTMASFLGAVVIAVLAEIMARWQKVPVSVYVVASFIPLVPGLTTYEAMGDFLRGEYTQGIAKSTQAGLIAIAIAAGLAVVSSIARYHKAVANRKHKKTP